MTAQMHDSFLFQDRIYSLVGYNGGPLFHPSDHGMQPLPRLISCWRGYVSKFDLPIDFTSEITIATGFIQKLYVHMGFHPAWKYETVFVLTLSGGDLLETKDVSGQMAELRDKMTRQPLKPGPNASGQELKDWIASTFERSYRS